MTRHTLWTWCAVAGTVRELERELAAKLEQLSARSPTGRLTTALSNAADSPPQDLPANTEARLEALALQTATVVTRGAGAVHRQLELKAASPERAAAGSGKLTLKKAQPVAAALDADTQQLAEEARQARAGALASQPGDVDVMASPQRTRSMADEANDLFLDDDEDEVAVGDTVNGSIMELGRSCDPKVQQLMDLGADEAQARSALKSNGDVKAASEIFFASGADGLEEQLAALGWADGEDVPEEEFVCEHDCGFKGSFAAVELHETACAAEAAPAAAAPAAQLAAKDPAKKPDTPKQPPQNDARPTAETPTKTKKNKKKKVQEAAVAVTEGPPRKARILQPTEELNNIDKKKGGVRVCRFGVECTREGCWFLHPAGYVAPPPGSDDMRGKAQREEARRKALEDPPELEPQPEAAAEPGLEVKLKSGEHIAVGKKGAAAAGGGAATAAVAGAGAAPGAAKKGKTAAGGSKAKTPGRDGAACTAQNCQFGHPGDPQPKPAGAGGGGGGGGGGAGGAKVTFATVEHFICDWVNAAGGEAELPAVAAALGKHKGYGAAAKKGTKQDTVEKAILRIVETSSLFETAGAESGGGGGGKGANGAGRRRGRR